MYDAFHIFGKDPPVLETWNVSITVAFWRWETSSDYGWIKDVQHNPVNEVNLISEWGSKI